MTEFFLPRIVNKAKMFTLILMFNIVLNILVSAIRQEKKKWRGEERRREGKRSMA